MSVSCKVKFKFSLCCPQHSFLMRPPLSPYRAPRSPSLCPFHINTVCSSLAHESCHSALSAIEAQIYAHEFITIFRYSHPAVLHPSDIRILEWIDEQSVLDEEDKGTVFLARDVMERLRRLTDRRLSIGARPSLSSRGGRRML